MTLSFCRTFRTLPSKFDNRDHPYKLKSLRKKFRPTKISDPNFNFEKAAKKYICFWDGLFRDN